LEKGRGWGEFEDGRPVPKTFGKKQAGLRKARTVFGLLSDCRIGGATPWGSQSGARGRAENPVVCILFVPGGLHYDIPVRLPARLTTVRRGYRDHDPLRSPMNRSRLRDRFAKFCLQLSVRGHAPEI